LRADILGIATFPDDARTADELLQAADLALFHAKALEWDCCESFQRDLR